MVQPYCYAQKMYFLCQLPNLVTNLCICIRRLKRRQNTKKEMRRREEHRGYNIGIRLIDEFLAKSNVSRCIDFKETAETIAKVGSILYFIKKQRPVEFFFSWGNEGIRFKNSSDIVFHIITMARLATLATLFAALLLVAHAAAAFHTTVTTVDVDDNIENQQRRGESCREQVQRQQNLNHCQRYMRQQCESGSFEDGNQQQHLQQCCQQLRRMDEQCRCEGLRQVVRQQQGELRGEEMREMMECARHMPNQCHLSPQRCEIRSAWF
ncbi:2S seed storage albumin protein-like [Alnus glutinosa]|uniref:2S seed storage albumin protein-like n=1 Tax=Alnus glutinosa TaxID=3517 RepID=UPI002D782D12|nr:2S seed storage albumin protein-like [Alnus glutinosa]